MLKIVLFVEPTDEKWSIGPKLGNWYINWFCIHEDAAFEVLGIHYLKPSHNAMKYSKHENYKQYAKERLEKGFGLKCYM